MATFFGIPLPGLSGFRDPTQQQIAQLQQGMTPADPYADSGWQPFNPNTARWNAGAQALAGLGAGLLSGRNWSEGLSRGLMGANQGFQDSMQDARRDYYVDQQGRYMQRKMQQEDRASARADAADQRKAAAIADLSANPPAGVDPKQWASMVAVDPEGMAAARGKSLFEKADAPKTVGGMMWNGSQYVPIPGYSEQAASIAAAGRAPPAQINIPKPPPTIEERDQAILEDGQRTGNTGTFAYASAYQRTYGAKLVPGVDAQGHPAMIPWAPTPPPGLPKPTYSGPGGRPTMAAPGGPAMGAAPPAAAPPAGGTQTSMGVTIGAPVATGGVPNNQGMTADAARKRTGLANADSALAAYDHELDAGGTSMLGTVGVPTPANARVGTAYQSLLVEMKNLYELGALSGPDYGIMLKSLVDPNSKGGVWLGVAGIRGQLGLIRDKLASARANIDQQYGPDPAAASRQQGAAPGGGNVAAPKTQADFDSLPSGALYHDPTDAPGTVRRKP